MKTNSRMKSYYAVIFSSLRSVEDTPGYEETAARMLRLAEKQPGSLGFESVRDRHGAGISVSYWKNKKSIKYWKNQAEHSFAQKKGRTLWYKQYKIRIALVKDEYEYIKNDDLT
jgi:heme-degrading monooxygenase HmoA